MSLPEAIVAASAILGAAHIAVWLIRLAHEDAICRRNHAAAERALVMWGGAPAPKPKRTTGD